jgi:hypothetical protein
MSSYGGGRPWKREQRCALRACAVRRALISSRDCELSAASGTPKAGSARVQIVTINPGAGAEQGGEWSLGRWRGLFESHADDKDFGALLASALGADHLTAFVAVAGGFACGLKILTHEDFGDEV